MKRLQSCNKANRAETLLGDRPLHGFVQTSASGNHLYAQTTFDTIGCECRWFIKETCRLPKSQTLEIIVVVFARILSPGASVAAEYQVPWLYREEFTLGRQANQHYFLQTNGITSQADIYVNGVQITSNLTQAGSCRGKKYEITKAFDRRSKCHPHCRVSYWLSTGFCHGLC